MVKKTFKITGMDCDACAKMIELDLEDLGISAKCDYAKKLLEVDLEDGKIEEKEIFSAVTKGGYELSPQ